MGFLSIVPTGAASDLQSAIAAASAAGGNFPSEFTALSWNIQ